jgi:hypothetical protein
MRWRGGYPSAIHRPKRVHVSGTCCCIVGSAGSGALVVTPQAHSRSVHILCVLFFLAAAAGWKMRRRLVDPPVWMMEWASGRPPGISQAERVRHPQRRQRRSKAAPQPPGAPVAGGQVRDGRPRSSRGWLDRCCQGREGCPSLERHHSIPRLVGTPIDDLAPPID